VTLYGRFWVTPEAVSLRPAPAPGQGIADIARDGIIEWVYEIVNADGTPVGSIMALGLGANINGTAPPGAPLEAMQGNSAIVGALARFSERAGTWEQIPH
jgi:hypothetical protein